MSRFLFVVPPLVGHINPALTVAAELRERGHDVAWSGPERLIRALGDQQARVFDYDAEPSGERGDLTGPAALQFLIERFLVPLARAMEPFVTKAVREFSPDVVVADQQAFAGGLVAEREGIPWVTSATTSTELSDPLGGMPKVKAWIDSVLAGLRSEIGDPAGDSDPRFSPHGILAFTTEDLAGRPAIAAERVWMVGPALRDSIETDFPWEFLDTGAHTVLISMGTVNGTTGAEFLRKAAAAIGANADRFRAVLVDPDSAVGEVPANVLVRPFVPQRALLPFIDAVVCHAGHNTVCEALWNGVPLVTAPIRDDQPVVAQHVADAGAGVRLRFRRATAEHIIGGIDAVLDPAAGYLAAAARIGQSFRAAGGAGRAADVLEELVTAPQQLRR
ncbi:glycosyltransferase [Hoyosella sp. YIM 151337]|uniref:glycosyltransferase n=1 Tax=Hoyosella sp. YIM 151337 TaxID=2992742 RepID=UPI002235DA5B|nr:glycosyltransferase [Hoyosella sp. YIM 151337]MCW4354238.1 glycosyltransferase [Hoyosella sp. YIM 151337]